MYKKNIVLVLIVLLFASCKTAQHSSSDNASWFSMAVAEDVEIFVDTASIKHVGAVAYATEKRVYTTPEARRKYVDKIRAEYAKMNKTEKADKWNDFSYCIYRCVYECTNKRFMIVSVEDYDSQDKRIARTTPPKDKAQWLSVNKETVGDYTFFFICDYE